MTRKMEQRIFVGIKVSENLRKKISVWRNGFKSGSKIPNSEVRWTKPRNLHVTLIPPWYESDVKEVYERVKKLARKYGPFIVRFEKVTLGPNSHRPRLVWAEGKASGDIVRLKERLEEILGRPAEKRRFRLHLTLARLRRDGAIIQAFKRFEGKIDWHEKVGSIVLMQSRLSSSGADYRVLKNVPLTAD